METPARNGAEAASARVRDTASEARSTLSDMGRQATETGKKVMHDIQEAGRDLGDASLETVEKFADQGRKQLATAEDYIRTYPVRSVIIGAFAGFVVSRLFKN